MKNKLLYRCFAAGLIVCGVSLAGGCATQDTVSPRFPLLKENINGARAVDAEVFAPLALKSAEAKFEKAKAALAAGNMVAANGFVDEAMVDADYARAKAPTEKGKSEAVKLRGEIQKLRDEINKMPALK